MELRASLLKDIHCCDKFNIQEEEQKYALVNVLDSKETYVYSDNDSNHDIS